MADQNAPMPSPADQPGSEDVAPGVRLPPAALQFTFARGGGPGGQNVNKVNTHAILTVPMDALAQTLHPEALDRLRGAAGRYLAAEPERLVIHASDSRSQLANRRACLLRLRHLLIAAMSRPKRRRPTRPSRAAKQRRLDNKRHRGRIKSDRQPPDGR